MILALILCISKIFLLEKCHNDIPRVSKDVYQVACSLLIKNSNDRRNKKYYQERRQGGRNKNIVIADLR